MNPNLRGDQEATSPAASENHGPIRLVLKQARRLIILVVGATIVLLGVAMLVLPGQGILTILVGLGILGAGFC